MPDTAPTPSPPPSPSVWQRRVIDPILRQLTQGISVDKIALTLAVGSACALFPILGTTTLLCLVVGISLRLNQPLIQLVNGLCTLPHLFVIYGLLRLGDFIFQVSPARMTVREFIFQARAHPNIWIFLRTLWGQQHTVFLHRMESGAVHSIVAWLVLAPFWILAVHWLSRRGLHRLNILRGGSLLPDEEGPAPRISGGT